MLAAISTTILSNRSWALTCSAMVSRSRLNRTRGPPDVLRMRFCPPPCSQPGGWPETGADLEKNYNFIHPAPSQPLYARPDRNHQNRGTICGSPSCSPYSELKLVLPSKTPAREQWLNRNFALAKRRSAGIPAGSGFVLDLIQSVERM